MTLACRFRNSILIAIVCNAVAVPAVRAEEPRASLATANGIFAAAAAIDWTSTYYALSNGCKEDNVLINGFQRHPPLLITAGAGIDVGGAWLWNRYVGRSHPRLARIGLYTAAGFRLYLAMRNVSAVTQQRAFDRAHGYATGPR